MKAFLKSGWAQTFFSLVIAGVVALFTLSVRAQIRDELKGFISKDQFVIYDAAHQKWGDEVIRGLRDDVAKMREELKAFRQEMNQKR